MGKMDLRKRSFIVRIVMGSLRASTAIKMCSQPVDAAVWHELHVGFSLIALS
jgi:hypothetical protein